MDAVTLSTLACVVLIAIERILARFQCPGFHGFSHVDLAVSRCCRLEVERQQSPPSSPMHASTVPSLERSVAEVIEAVASRRGSVMSPVPSNELATVSPPRP